MSSGAFSSSSCFTGATRGFEGVLKSLAINKFSPASTKSEGNQNNLALAFEGVVTFI
jgi:hypothetical protein